VPAYVTNDGILNFQFEEMNIQQIEYIIAVGKLKSFGLAAEQCFITQSTLSTMVARFENEIGVRIFDRKTKPITITKEGEEVIGQLKVISKEIGHLHEVVNRLKGEVTGDLKIGVIPTVAPYVLPLFLYEFIKKFPKVQFEISEISTEKIMENIKKRDLDIGIVSIPLNEPDIVEIPLYYEPFLLYDQANNSAKKHFSVSDIDLERLWLLEEGHCMRTQVETICDLRQQRMMHGNLDYKSGTIATLMKFVHNNNGVTLLPLLATLDLPENEQVHLKKFRPPIPVRNIGLVTHKHFVKKNMLKLLKAEVQRKVMPLIGKTKSGQEVILPLN